MVSHILLIFSLENSRFSLFLEVPEESCHFHPVPEEKGEGREDPVSALGCSLHHEILTFPAGFNLE